jgi:hypothetical protein
MFLPRCEHLTRELADSFAGCYADATTIQERMRRSLVRTSLPTELCLGAHLARLETKILFQELLPRLRSIELAGPVERIRSDLVNGIKRMPVHVDTI